jgi:phosphoglycolate phosphatase-like HAD superfamily hydrolase
MGKENGFFFAGSPGSALAGKKAGIYTIGIGSYRYGEKELSAAGADITFGSFKEKGKILRLLKA